MTTTIDDQCPLAARTVADDWVPPSSAGSAVIRVTPTLAAHWLALNANNRPINTAFVDRLVEDALSGRWIYDGSPIRFTRERIMADGQHRLSMVVKAGQPINFMVSWGFSPAAVRNMDTGRSRTARDVLTARGIDDQSGSLTALARFVISWSDDEGLTNYSQRRSVSRIVEAVENDRSIIDARDWVFSSVDRKRFGPAAVTGFCLWLFRRIDALAADEFMDSTVRGAELGPTDPRLALSKAVARARGATSMQERTKLVAVFIKSWNAWRQHQPLTLAKFGYGEKFPIPV